MPKHQGFSRPRVRALVGLALLVFLSCWLSISLTRESGRVAALWLSNGLVIGLLLTAPPRQWPAWLTAATLGNLAANLYCRDALVPALGLAGCNLLEILVASVPLARRFDRATKLMTPQGALQFVVFAVLLAPMVSGAAAAAVLQSLTDVTDRTLAAARAAFSVWWRADALGILIVAPVVLALRLQWRTGLRIPAKKDLWWTFLLLTLSCLATFSQQSYPLLFMVLPFLLVVTAKHGLIGAAGGSALVATVAITATLEGRGPIMLVRPDAGTGLWILQLFLAVATLKSLAVSILMSERERLAAALRRSEQQLRAVSDNMPALIAHIDADERYRFVNAHITKVFGDPAESMMGRTMREVRGETIYSDIRPHVQAALRGESVTFESAAALGDRYYHYQSVYVPDRDEAGAVRGFYAMTFDITARKQSELQQAASEERLRTITNNMPGLIAFIDRQGHYRFCNDTHGVWFGRAAADWIGRHYSAVIDSRFGEEQRPNVERALAGERVDAELILHCNDTARAVNACYLPEQAPDGSIKGCYVLMTDVTKLKQTQIVLDRLARYDTLTGLANRYEFYQRLDSTLARQYRQQQNLAVLYLDIDHFKQINDTHGHAAGDAVLAEVAIRLSASVRASDTTARLAGDEFVAIIDALHNPDESQFVARKILAAMEKPIALGTTNLRVNVSIGVAYDANTGRSREELLQVADGALYEAKREGRNTFRQVIVRAPGVRWHTGSGRVG